MSPTSDETLAAAWLALAARGEEGRSAIALVAQEARRLARSMRDLASDGDLADELVHTVVLAVHSAAQSWRFEATLTDAEQAENARRYLKRALKNAVTSHRKTAQRRDDRVDLATRAAPPDDDEGLAGLDPEMLNAAFDAFMTKVVEPAGRRKREGRLEALQQAATEMFDLARGARDVPSLLGLDPDHERFGRERNALYQRHTRARRDLGRHLDQAERLAFRDFDPEELARYRRLLDTLRRRR